ncbi:arrestin domain-containing protein 3-like [Pagrus major]|uniref:arrestin domain-containing protein 3-like n=1 Tax=Pagrus major TaxID=143350 RepID=UPI003CC8DE58
MPSVHSLTMTYDLLNDSGTFSEGDPLVGKVTLVLLKEITVESLFVKAKGDSSVRWTEKSGDRDTTYSAAKRYFKQKQFLIAENAKGAVLPRGTHVFNFRINIPSGSMPPSFKGNYGKIVYVLEAKLTRSWRMDCTDEKKICFVSKAIPNPQSLMLSQTGSTDKEIGIFGKRKVDMDVFVDKRAYAPGETVVVLAKINNASSSNMTPKVTLIQDVLYRAQHHKKQQRTTIFKVSDHCINAKTQKDVKWAIKLPRDLTQTIQNCEIITLEYCLKVYLDISFSFDPEVIFPVVIIPPDLAHGPQPGVAAGPYPARAIGGPSNSDFPPPAVAMGPYPAGAYGGPSNIDFPPPAVPVGPYAYGQPGSYSAPPPAYPAQPAHVSQRYNNPVPQAVSPYGDPHTAPSSTLHPPPPAPTFHPPPSAPEIQPPPFSQAFNMSPSAPVYNMLPSAPMANTDFLSQSDEAPPAYALLFPPSANERSDAK